MSAADLLNDVESIVQVVDRHRRHPTAWLLVANSVYGRAESYDIVALFDTEQMAAEYEVLSRLTDFEHCPDGMVRGYRSDSLLRDYNRNSGNAGSDSARMVFPALPSHLFQSRDIPVNPTIASDLDVCGEVHES